MVGAEVGYMGVLGGLRSGVGGGCGSRIRSGLRGGSGSGVGSGSRCGVSSGVRREDPREKEEKE